MHNLEASIARLYEAFATVAKPTHIEGCSCCISESEIESLLTTPLKSIAPERLTAYASSAFLTVGTKADYLYFLPRIVEISATTPGWWPDPEVTGRAIASAEPATWTESQRSALADVYAAIIDSAIRSEDDWLLDRWVCTIGRSDFAIEPYLEMIARDPKATLGYLDTNESQLTSGQLINAFWDTDSAVHARIVEWCFSPAIARIYEEEKGFELTRLPE